MSSYNENIHKCYYSKHKEIAMSAFLQAMQVVDNIMEPQIDSKSKHSSYLRIS